jgi:predicted enzyme related to lactoylglutathione lyase
LEAPMRSKIGWPAWIGVVAEDLAAQAAFYRDVLGFHEVEADEESVLFEFEGRTFELLARADQAQYDARRVQVGFEVDDIESAQAELVDAGVEPVTGIEISQDSASRWAYFRDPEGNVFEITERHGTT